MDNLSLIDRDLAERARVDGSGILPTRRRTWWPGVALIAVLAALAGVGGEWLWRSSYHAASPPAPPPQVTVSLPLQQTVQATERFLGQFAAVDSVELRAQVSGTLTGIEFRDGQIVHKGDPLFVIDPRPFQIRLEQAAAQFQTAQARETLSEAELWRAQELKRTDFGTAETVDQRAAEQRSQQAAIRDAQLDLEFARDMTEKNAQNHRLGYARVSTYGQTLAAELEQLRAAGCHPIYREKVTGARADRRELLKLLKAIGPGDVVTVTRIDRLARSTFDLFAIVKLIVDAKPQFRSLAEPWADTSTSTGRLMIAVLGGLADVERDLIRTRTAEGCAFR
jgi:multidrug efflux pump subunit AcrA (membrane-fusion protein)